MSRVALAIVLAVIWAAITGSFSAPNLLLGGSVAILALLVIRKEFAPPVYLRKIRRAASLAVLFLHELALSAYRVSVLILSPNMKSKLKPGIIAFPLSVTSDVEITLLANLITLTPGTLSIDVSEDRKFLYVHALSVPDKKALVKEIAGGFEAKIIEVFK
ncbi:Na(+) H(+) antiporter subunit E [hydrothermal vent metagenome]|uniref:Na(+) H(+) antiporter subunit E n=1 Tax=hydrothermal vent metagenome TaxID=652676 RepID=A0A3B0UD18_9ZZZZ